MFLHSNHKRKTNRYTFDEYKKRENNPMIKLVIFILWSFYNCKINNTRKEKVMPNGCEWIEVELDIFTCSSRGELNPAIGYIWTVVQLYPWAVFITASTQPLPHHLYPFHLTRSKPINHQPKEPKNQPSWNTSEWWPSWARRRRAGSRREQW